MKRLSDFLLSMLGLMVLLPLLLPIILLVWLQDRHSPFYIAPRVGKDGRIFNMFKLRSMVVGADRNGVDSTSNNDDRITVVGHFIRKYKLDETMQLINVLAGHMSMVGPRPNVLRGVETYSEEENGLLAVKPGITDVASIVFSDEGAILAGYSDPDLAYDKIIRPWKSKYGLLYIENKNLVLDAKLIFITIVNAVSRKRGLEMITSLVSSLTIDSNLVMIASRDTALSCFAPK